MASALLTVVYSLSLPLVTVLATLMPHPRNPAKQNAPSDQDSGVVGHLLTSLAALMTIAPLTLPLDSEGAQEPTTKLARRTRTRYSQGVRLQDQRD